jgi:hypothetical protein
MLYTFFFHKNQSNEIHGLTCKQNMELTYNQKHHLLNLRMPCSTHTIILASSSFLISCSTPFLFLFFLPHMLQLVQSNTSDMFNLVLCMYHLDSPWAHNILVLKGLLVGWCANSISYASSELCGIVNLGTNFEGKVPLPYLKKSLSTIIYGMCQKIILFKNFWQFFE